FSYAVIFEYAGKLFDLFEQLLVSQYTMGFRRVIRLPDNRGFIAEFINMPIEAIFRDIKPSALKPFDFRILKIPVQHLIPFTAPIKIFGNTRPEFLGLFYAILVGLLIIIK